MGLRDVFKSLLILIILVVAVFQNKNQTFNHFSTPPYLYFNICHFSRIAQYLLWQCNKVLQSTVENILVSKVRLIFLKCCRENLSFRNLMLGEKEWKYVAQQISPAHRTINFSQLLKRNLLSETYSFSGSTGIYLIEFNNNNNKVQNKFKVNNRTTRQNSAVFLVNFKYIWHVVLVFFLLTLNM